MFFHKTAKHIRTHGFWGWMMRDCLNLEVRFYMFTWWLSDIWYCHRNRKAYLTENYKLWRIVSFCTDGTISPDDDLDEILGHIDHYIDERCEWAIERYKKQQKREVFIPLARGCNKPTIDGETGNG